MKKLREQDLLTEDDYTLSFKKDKFYRMMREEKFKKKKQWS